MSFYCLFFKFLNAIMVGSVYVFNLIRFSEHFKYILGMYRVERVT